MAVEVRDEFSGAPIASGSKLVAQAESYADSMSFPVGQPDFNSSRLTGAFRPGVYTLTVTADDGFNGTASTSLWLTAYGVRDARSDGSSSGSDPTVTDYILEAPAKCPNCRREILEEALVEPL